MKKYKICVYAICKNESQFVERWMNSVKEADEVCVLDTGSTDDTVQKLQNLGAKVTVEVFNPWRFDKARNRSLELVPNDCDICVCTDLDEIIEPGWRNKLENIWDLETNCLSYNYNWSFDIYGKPAVNFYIEKIHDRHSYLWYHPVHEVLKYIKESPEIKKVTDEITVNHYPDNSKPRSQYLPLLELSVEEDPEDDRNMHYLGREYMFNQKWLDAISTFHRHLKLPKAVWKPERCASMRFMGRCYNELGYKEEAIMWLERSIMEYPQGREGYVELALLEYFNENYNRAYYLLKEALKIKERSKIYINENFCWDSTIYDVLSICAFNVQKYKEAYEYIKKAVKLAPDDKRLKKNKSIIKKNIKK